MVQAALGTPIAGSNTSAPKYIIALCDGTGKDGEKDEHTTNVYQLHKKIETGPQKTIVHGVRYELVSRYFRGIGCGMAPVPGYLAKVFGKNIVKLVLQVYMYIIEQYRPGDHVCIFGYSRGAFVARKVAILLHHLGRSVSREGDLLEQWKNRENPVPWGPKVTPDPVPVKYLGVWDTVGGIYSFPGLSEVKDFLGIPDEEIPSGVKHALHAVSFHENRYRFRVTLFDDKQKTGREEVWFPGAHSDIGGGDKETELSKISLNWMISKVDAFSHLKPSTIDYAAAEKLAPRDAFHETPLGKRVVDHEETRIQSKILRWDSQIHQTVRDLDASLPDSTRLATLEKLRKAGWKDLGFVVPCPTARPKRASTAGLRFSTWILPDSAPAPAPAPPQPERRRTTPPCMRQPRPVQRTRSWALTLVVDQFEDADEWQIINY